VHHGTEYVGAALDSCPTQTLADLEVVLVLAQGDAASAAYAGSIADARVHMLHAGAGLSLAMQWNAGVARARGHHLMVMTDTERLEPDTLERMLALMPPDSGIECVYAAFRVHDLSTGRAQAIASSADAQDACFGRVNPCYVFTRSARERVGGWDPCSEPAVILDHWIRLFRACDVRHCDAVLCESVGYPWRTKNPDWIDLGLMEAAVRQRHQLDELSALRPWLRRYIVGIWKRPGDWRLLWRWFAPTGRRLRSMRRSPCARSPTPRRDGCADARCRQ